jgi:hypothetical protein
VRLANLYRASDAVHIEQADLLSAAGAVLKSDADFSAAIAFTFRTDLVDVFFAGDLYAGTGVVVDPRHPPRVGDSLEATAQQLRNKPFEEYFFKVFLPFYLSYKAGSTPASLLEESDLDSIADKLRTDSEYYVQTNSDDLILDHVELGWLRATLGPRIAVYDHGGHLGNLGERQQIADMLDMVGGRWPHVDR